ncbi:MAG TPA: 3-deoxy-D-manno-octulosonic acid transferase [Thermoanaerobaculia bacterium]|nr:3-deoxy-D-manno-octulosonic acid transferase [Thermoanaerobaculia bacterium]
MFALYQALLWAVFLLLLPWFGIVGFLRGKYWSSFRERMGLGTGPAGRRDVWIQAVSVGEVTAARALVEHLRERRPDLSLVLTTTTATGQALAHRFFPADAVAYFPFDFTYSVERFLERHQPRVFVAIETEIWPNAARLAKRSGARVAIVNGRISDRSFGRYRAIRLFLRRVLAYYDMFLVRSAEDGTRYAAIGAAAHKIEVTGNLKFDLTDLVKGEGDAANEALRLADGRPILVLGSTMEGEDEALLQELSRLASLGVFTVIAPRKPQRFEVVAGLLATSGLSWGRRTEAAKDQKVDVFLLDSIGELAGVYGVAKAAFVGGSLVARGGHNPIEPIGAGAPVAFGPHMSNFRGIAEAFLSAGAATRIKTPEELTQFVERMLVDESLRLEMIERGRRVVVENRGAAERIAAKLLELLAAAEREGAGRS